MNGIFVPTVSDDDKRDEKPFEVKDRRRFDATGESVPGEDGFKGEPSPETAAAGESSSGSERTAATGDGALPPVEFSTLLLSLASSVVLHLGEMPRPDTGKVERNLELAKQTIDLLGMLQEKTRGNLTKDEADLFESLLYELRLKYVQAVR